MKLTELLDFSDWTLFEIEGVRILNETETKEMESLLTKYIDEMSQEDHVNLVVTYKAKIKELETLLDECFESAIAPLGAGEPMKPSAELEDLANRVFQRIKHKTK